MAKRKPKLPSMQTILNLLREYPVDRANYIAESDHTPESRKMIAEANAIIRKVRNSKKVKDLFRKAQNIQKNNYAKRKREWKQRVQLVARIKLRGVTPAIVNEVEGIVNKSSSRI